MWLLAMLLLTCSCGEEFSTLETTDKEGGIPLQLSVSMDNSGFSSDSEVIPMGTRAEKEPYVVTRINSSTLFIVKKEGDDQWALVDIKDDIIDKKNAPVLELKLGESLGLKTTDYVLLPGQYRFLLLVNAFTNKKTPLNEVFTNNVPLAMTSNMPVGDFFFAQYDITLKKTEGLNQDATEEKIILQLKRNSALIRFVMEGRELGLENNLNPTIFYSVNGLSCTGMNILGENVTVKEGWNVEPKTEMRMENAYQMNVKDYFFAPAPGGNTNSSPSFYMDNEENSTINLTINKIGNELHTQYSFEGKKEINGVPIQRNHITTILIRKTGENEIECKVNPNTDAWDTGKYPPLNYIELNNK